MALSDREITAAIKTGQIEIRPSIARLNPAGVDLSIDRDLTLKPGRHTLAASVERVELSRKFLGILHIRSSLAREGVIASLALVDPGFRGQLTVSLYNAGDRQVKLRKGERFIQLSLLRLGRAPIQGYSGKYQDSRGVVKSRRKKMTRQRKMESIIQGTRG